MKRYIKASYDAWGINSINKFMKIGIECRESGMSEPECVHHAVYELNVEGSEAITFVASGYRYGSEFYPAKIKTWYRIGEPRQDIYNGAYHNSYNFAEDKPEDGVSVISESWLHSTKSIFFWGS